MLDFFNSLFIKLKKFTTGNSVLQEENPVRKFRFNQYREGKTFVIDASNLSVSEIEQEITNILASSKLYTEIDFETVYDSEYNCPMTCYVLSLDTHNFISAVKVENCDYETLKAINNEFFVNYMVDIAHIEVLARRQFNENNSKDCNIWCFEFYNVLN